MRAQNATTSRPLSLATVFGAPLALVAAGHLLVLQRAAHPTKSYLAIRGDSNAYIEMVQGHWRTMRVPFRYRVFVPWLAHLLPVSPLTALRLISYVSLFGFYAITLATCRTFTLTRNASFVGLFAIFTAWWHLYQYNNPFVIDSFVLFVLSATVLALLHEKFGWFVVLLVVGRMFAPMSLFVTCACAQVVQSLLDNGDDWKFWIAPLVAVSIVQAVVSVIPMVWIDEHRFLFRTAGHRAGMFALSGAYAVIIAWHFRQDLTARGRRIGSNLGLRLGRRGGARA
jgi:hypothetical protein